MDPKYQKLLGPPQYQKGIQGRDASRNNGLHVKDAALLRFFSYHTILQIESKIGYTFKRKELLALAFVHKSFSNESNSKVEEEDERIECNERLEFLGDSILQTLASVYLYRALPRASEGRLTELRTYVVGFKTCAYYTLKLGLQGFLLTGSGTGYQWESRLKMTTDLFEAVLGAIYEDGGWDAADGFFKRCVQDYANKIIDCPKYNYKKTLQDFCTKNCHRAPEYETLEGGELQEPGKPQRPFKVQVRLGGVGGALGIGTGKKRKDAEQEAAFFALRAIQERHQEMWAKAHIETKMDYEGALDTEAVLAADEADWQAKCQAMEGVNRPPGGTGAAAAASAAAAAAPWQAPARAQAPPSMPLVAATAPAPAPAPAPALPAAPPAVPGNLQERSRNVPVKFQERSPRPAAPAPAPAATPPRPAVATAAVPTPRPAAAAAAGAAPAGPTLPCPAASAAAPAPAVVPMEAAWNAREYKNYQRMASQELERCYGPRKFHLKVVGRLREAYPETPPQAPAGWWVAAVFLDSTLLVEAPGPKQSMARGEAARLALALHRAGDLPALLRRPGGLAPGERFPDRVLEKAGQPKEKAPQVPWATVEPVFQAAKAVKVREQANQSAQGRLKLKVGLKPNDPLGDDLKYVLVKTEGPQHLQMFTMAVEVRGRRMAEGAPAKNKRLASKAAAQAALAQLTAEEEKETNGSNTAQAGGGPEQGSNGNKTADHTAEEEEDGLIEEPAPKKAKISSPPATKPREELASPEKSLVDQGGGTAGGEGKGPAGTGGGGGGEGGSGGGGAGGAPQQQQRPPSSPSPPPIQARRSARKKPKAGGGAR